MGAPTLKNRNVRHKSAALMMAFVLASSVRVCICFSERSGGVAAPAAPLAVDAWGSDAGRDREQALENTLALSGLLGARAEKPRRDRPSAPSSRVEAELEPADAQEGQEVSRLLGMDAIMLDATLEAGRPGATEVPRPVSRDAPAPEVSTLRGRGVVSSPAADSRSWGVGRLADAPMWRKDATCLVRYACLLPSAAPREAEIETVTS